MCHVVLINTSMLNAPEIQLPSIKTCHMNPGTTQTQTYSVTPCNKHLEAFPKHLTRHMYMYIGDKE